VPSLITPLMPDNTAEARRAKAKGKQRRIRVPPDSASRARPPWEQPARHSAIYQEHRRLWRAAAPQAFGASALGGGVCDDVWAS
jgi:hypothetical protein